MFIEADDAENALARVMAATDDFNKWFQQTVLVDTHGIDLNAPPPPSNTVHVATEPRTQPLHRGARGSRLPAPTQLETARGRSPCARRGLSGEWPLLDACS